LRESFTFSFCSILLAGVFAFCLAHAQTVDRAEKEKQNLSKDLVVQALELVKTGTKKEAEDGLQLLKQATEASYSNGDAWYYRAVFETQSGQPVNAPYAMEKARKYGSEAMDQGLNPFHLATAPAPNVTTAALEPLGEKWALVVGISQFHDKHLPRLNFTSKDAKDFTNFLLDPNVGHFKPENVHSFTDGEVTTRQLKMELNWLARSAQPNDMVVIFLSSHGTPRNRDTADVNYIATSDTETEPEDNLFGSSIPLADISDIVRSRVKAKRTVILLDTCHSGAAIKGAQAGAALKDSAPSDNAIDRIRQGVGRAILTSSSPDEQSYEGKPYDNGYFTHFLLEALRKNKGNSTMEQVYASLSPNVSKAAASIQRKQTPVFSKSEHGDEIVIGAKPGAAN
jgi:hypothetical protein